MARPVFLSFVVIMSLLATAMIAGGISSLQHGYGPMSASDWRDGYGIDDRTAMVTARSAVGVSTDQATPR